jgi:hypothetical protein
MIKELLTKLFTWCKSNPDDNPPDMGVDCPNADDNTAREITPAKDKITTVGKLTLKF